MKNAFAANVSSTAPAPGTAIGCPQDGDPVAGKVATVPGAGWFWSVTAELLAIIVGGGLTPDSSTLNQVWTAIKGYVDDAINSAVQGINTAITDDFTQALVTGVNGHRKLPGGLIEQWCEAAGTGGASLAITYPIPFTNTAHTPRVSATNPGATDPGANDFVGVTVISSGLTGCVVFVGQVAGGNGSTTICVDVKGT